MLTNIIEAVKHHNRRQAISDEMDWLDNVEDTYGWTYDIEQKRLLLRLQLAALSHEPEVAR